MGREEGLEAIKKRVSGLKLVYKKHPQKELLIALPNPNPGKAYEVEAVSPEFTSLCPLNPGQPDYATVTIRYVPDEKIIELKSLKFYLTSYRTAEVFFEDATNRILDDLVAVIKPKKMEVVADWNVRGGIAVTVRASYP
jgi:7-cyano-7-deazaguanine reductase